MERGRKPDYIDFWGFILLFGSEKFLSLMPMRHALPVHLRVSFCSIDLQNRALRAWSIFIKNLPPTAQPPLYGQKSGPERGGPETYNPSNTSNVMLCDFATTPWNDVDQR